MFAETRDDVRSHFLSVWRKVAAGAPLEPLEQLIAAIIERHPEYHALLQRPDEAMRFSGNPEAPFDNPFLHMSLHIALSEQLQTDRPPGVVQAYQAMLGRAGADAHTVEHEMMQCLAASLAEAQARAAPPDERAYLACLRRRA